MDDSDRDEGRKEERRVVERRELPRERRAGPGRRIWIRRSSEEEVSEESAKAIGDQESPDAVRTHGDRLSAVKAIDASTDERPSRNWASSPRPRRSAILEGGCLC